VIRLWFELSDLDETATSHGKAESQQTAGLEQTLNLSRRYRGTD
jgi:hypothetical protein